MAMMLMFQSSSLMAQNKREFELNYAAQKQTTNASLEDRQRARVASNAGAYQSADAGGQRHGKGPPEHDTDDRLQQRGAPGPGGRGQRDVRAGSPDGLAHPPAGADPDRDRRVRPGSAVGRTGRGTPAGGRGLVPAG